jgi:hypothetical protein
MPQSHEPNNFSEDNQIGKEKLADNQSHAISHDKYEVQIGDVGPDAQLAIGKSITQIGSIFL